jgi:hypothetical protein
MRPRQAKLRESLLRPATLAPWEPGTPSPAPPPIRVAARRIHAAPWLLLALLLAIVADFVEPALPALSLLAIGAMALGIAALAAAALRPGAAWRTGLLAATLPAALLLPLLAWLQQATPRGLMAARMPAIAALQEAVFPPPPGPALPAEALRDLLADPAAKPRRYPASADEALFNAILLDRADAPLPAAQALALSLRLGPEPRPDALLLMQALQAGGVASARAALATLPESLSPATRAQVAALRLAEPAARAAALDALLATTPDALELVPALARALAEASPPEGATVATAARVVALLDRLAAAADDPAFVARFLDPGLPGRIAEALRDLSPMREIAARRLAATIMAPPPGMPDLPMLLRVTPPEPWRAVQMLERPGTRTEAWIAVPQRQDDTAESGRDSVPTLRLGRPWRAREFRFRYLDRDGIASPEVAIRFEPAPAIREAAQRALQRQGPFALYMPGRLANNRLNALPVAAHLRPGLAAVEWFTDAERRPKRADLALSDAAVLAANAPRGLVEFEVPPAARSLFLTAVYADGTRSAVQELPIR